jgi:hypothetical protein
MILMIIYTTEIETILWWKTYIIEIISENLNIGGSTK